MAVTIWMTASGWVGFIMSTGGTLELPQAGWSTSGIGLEPASGEWLGFRRGGGRLEAAQNACALQQSGRLLEPYGFDCAQDRFSRSLLAFSSNHETWSFRPKLRLHERHCLGRRPERLVIDLTGDHVQRISVNCGFPGEGQDDPFSPAGFLVH